MHNQNINHGLYHQGEFSYNYGSAYYNNYTNWSGGTTTNHNKPVKIINKLKGKAKCVYNKLQNISGGFRNMIQKFDGDFPVSHLTFKINNNLRSGNYGRTNPPNNYNITIEMSNVQLRKISDLGAAVSFAHEVIHAEIYRKMLSAAKKGHLNIDDKKIYTTQDRTNYANSLRNNFPGLYDYYWKRNHKEWNHNMMASHYIDTIVLIIQRFDNYRYSRRVYEYIAWYGLRKTRAWNNLSPGKRKRIKRAWKRHFYKRKK